MLGYLLTKLPKNSVSWPAEDTPGIVETGPEPENADTGPEPDGPIDMEGPGAPPGISMIELLDRYHIFKGRCLSFREKRCYFFANVSHFINVICDESYVEMLRSKVIIQD